MRRMSNMGVEVFKAVSGGIATIPYWLSVG